LEKGEPDSEEMFLGEIDPTDVGVGWDGGLLPEDAPAPPPPTKPWWQFW
jgi:hypothetical protein